jgi:cytochrome c553
MRLLTCLLTGAAAIAAHAAGAAPPFEDSIAQRMQACTGCHGAEGRSTPGGYQPRLAGKPAGYLLHQLQNFQAGRRHYGPMTALVDPLTDVYLREIADYFSSLNLPYAPPARSTATAATLQRGEQLVRRGDAARGVPACNQCHGDTMMGVAPAIPGLLGLPHDYVNSQLGAWRTGKRQAQSPDCMAHVAQQLNATDVDAVSQWLAVQPVPPGAKPSAALPVGAKLPLACGGVAIDVAVATPAAMPAATPTASPTGAPTATAASIVPVTAPSRGVR